MSGQLQPNMLVPSSAAGISVGPPANLASGSLTAATATTAGVASGGASGGASNASNAGQYEASLHASVTSGNVCTRLLDRLEAICGHGPGKPFADHIIAFVPTDNRKTTTALTAQEVQLRLRRDISPTDWIRHDELHTDVLHCRDWLLGQYGHPETRPGRQVTVRPFLQTNIEGNALLFTTALGYGFLLEYARRGYLFIFDGTIEVHVYQCYKLNVRQSIASASPVDTDWIVEATAVSPDSEQIPRAVEALLRLKALLAG
ncbi:hypothetical protein BDF19DRAFT_450465 [Syncephalis fuscata]|nr:hypothetical protein BDF19DRAFT_450465 [Syncephalis fuscata]